MRAASERDDPPRSRLEGEAFTVNQNETKTTPNLFPWRPTSLLNT